MADCPGTGAVEGLGFALPGTTTVYVICPECGSAYTRRSGGVVRKHQRINGTNDNPNVSTGDDIRRLLARQYEATLMTAWPAWELDPEQDNTDYGRGYEKGCRDGYEKGCQDGYASAERTSAESMKAQYEAGRLAQRDLLEKLRKAVLDQSVRIAEAHDALVTAHEESR